jgi:hypothetical protein
VFLTRCFKYGFLFQHKNDPLFIEFMETHAKGNKAVWSNDTMLNEDSKNIRAEKDDDSGHESNDVSKSEDEEDGIKDNVAKKKISDLEVCSFLHEF